MTQRYRNYVFTSYKFTESYETYLNDLSKETDIKYICGQVEKCPSTNRLHIQGYVELSKQLRLSSIKALMINNEIHIENRMGSQTEAINYCKKLDSQVKPFKEYGIKNEQGQRTDLQQLLEDIKNEMPLIDLVTKWPSQYMRYSNGIEKMINIYKNEKNKNILKDMTMSMTLRQWQTETIEHLVNQNDRQITWIYDQEGGAGKSKLQDWLVANKNAFMTEGGRKQDITYRYDSEEIIAINFSRSTDNDNINYGLIEKFKDGRIQSDKYMSTLKIVKEPKVIVFSNQLPDALKWSRDRYEIGVIKNNNISWHGNEIITHNSALTEPDNYIDDLDQ